MALATAPMELVLAVDMTKSTPTFAAGSQWLAVASSPSSHKTPRTPRRATSMGEGTLTSKRVIWGGRESVAYVKVTMELLQRLQVVPVCAPSSGVASVYL